MVQESTMICVDNSEFMRNGDFAPNRLQAQQEAANLILQCKLRANPESTVGVLSMGGKVDVLATLTTDSSKLFMKLHQVQPCATSKFLIGLRVAHLALKHRQNRNHKTRIVLFVGSPLDEIEEKEFEKMAKRFKKEKVLVDVICFGESDTQNTEKLNAFIETLNGKDGTSCNLVVVPAGSQLTEALLSSAICRGEDGAAPAVAVGGAGGGGFDFGLDANDDPELAMALRVSLEEQRQRQEQQVAASIEGEGPIEIPAEAAPSTDEGGVPDWSAMTEEQQLALALQMSMQDDGRPAASGEETAMEVSSTSEAAAAAEPMVVEEGGAEEGDQFGELISDPAALQELISSLPGVDPNSEEIRRAVAETTKKAQEKKTDGDGKPGSKKDDSSSGSK